MTNEKTYVLTSAGFLELETELNELKNVRRPEIINALKEARALGDLSENADYDAARNEQAQIEAKINEIEYKLEHSTIAASKSKSSISLGSLVTVEYDDGEKEEFTIVSSAEANLFNNKISNESPLGNALLDHKKGDSVKVDSPNGVYSIKILNIA